MFCCGVRSARLFNTICIKRGIFLYIFGFLYTPLNVLGNAEKSKTVTAVYVAVVGYKCCFCVVLVAGFGYV